MSFDHFIDTLDSVPPEVERNFMLIKKLDDQSKEICEKINDCVCNYKRTRHREKRMKIEEKTNKLFKQLNSYADDKFELAYQTYELIDKNIVRLINMAKESAVAAPKDREVGENGIFNIEPELIGFGMPIDEGEPRYCTCGDYSHGEMIQCNNIECPIEWFHMSCLKMKKAPRGNWYCGQCNHINSKKKSRSRRKSSY